MAHGMIILIECFAISLTCKCYARAVMTKKQKTKEELKSELKEVSDKYQELLRVVQEIEKLPGCEFYYLNRFKEKHREDFK
jgi:hypothetical protein